MPSPADALARFTPATAWKPYFPNASNPWDDVKIAHLYRRAAFGANWGQIEEGIKSSPEKLVTRLVRGPGDVAIQAFEQEIAPLRDGVLGAKDPLEARALWFYRMLNSPYPLRERMTLFWHNHFATSIAKVRELGLMQRQNEILRRHALGHFDVLLSEMTFDPAMIVWLDSNTNKKGQPNENYGRELMELFSLGVGNYTEKDIQEAARALTGWDMKRGETVFHADQFDDGEKTVFGRTGRFTAGDTVRLCLGQDACALFLVRKLFRDLISDTINPTDELLKPLADGLRARNYDITWVVETMLRSWVFYSPAAIGQKVKSPCDFLVGTVIAMEGRPSLTLLAEASDQLGQSLFAPPSVKGWDGGPAWINSSTLLKRQNYAFEMTRGNGVVSRLDPARLISKYGVSGTEGLARFFLRLFHQRVEPQTVEIIVRQLDVERHKLTDSYDAPEHPDTDLARSAAHLALTLPEYQLG